MAANLGMAIAIAVMLSISLYSSPLFAHAQSDGFGASEEQIINTRYSGPVFLDSYWTSSSSSSETTGKAEIEVGPGDGSSNLAVVLVNRGLSDITSIKGHLTLPSGFITSGKGATVTATFNEIVEQGETFTMFFDVDVSENARVGPHNAQLRVDYSRLFETGAPRSEDISVPFTLTGKVILDTIAADQGISPGVANKVGITVENTGSADATGVVITVTGIAGLSSEGQDGVSAVNVGTRTFNVGTIPAGSSATITPVIYPSESSGGTVQNVLLDMTYTDASGTRQTAAAQVGIVVSQNSAESPLKVRMNDGSTSIVAGKVQDVILTIINNGESSAEGIAVTLNAESDSVEILGDYKWTAGSLDSGDELNLETKIFASESLIGSPTSFDVEVQYVSAGEPKGDTLSIGTYVDGEIDIRAYDFSINYLGETPNILGNLLNEGNTEALFTTVDLVAESTEAQFMVSQPPQQYLGDLTENSPLPFSIPIEIDQGTPAGEYAVGLKITYKDNLRESHEIVVNTVVDFVPRETTGEAEESSSQGPAIGMAIGIAIAAAIAILFFRKRRSKAKVIKSGNGKKDDDDIEALLNSSISARKEQKN